MKKFTEAVMLQMKENEEERDKALMEKNQTMMQQLKDSQEERKSRRNESVNNGKE